MLATEILPDLATMLPRIEFLRELDIKVSIPADPALSVEIAIGADGVPQTPPTGEIGLPDILQG